MIDLTAHPEQIARNAAHAHSRGIVLPTFEQMIDPSKVPAEVRERLRDVGLWDVDPANLFRVTWHNEPRPRGGTFGGVNVLEIPREITGVRARIFGLVGKWFPTGAHKVGAATACLVPRLVTGQFDPASQKAVWPSTGNYCRGGAYISALLACTSVAILPAEMSRERFEWLAKVAGEVIATPGCESNVKEIYDKCWELRRTRPDAMIFNQFEEFGNYLWHHEVTGRAVEEGFKALSAKGSRLSAYVACTGSGGTLAAGDYLKKVHPQLKIVAGEALQCPTLLANGYGAHRIEGIGDKHVPWIHNVRNTDIVAAIDDEACVRTLRLFNEPAGRKHLISLGADPQIVNTLGNVGISCVANLIGAIKTAKYMEMDENDVVATIFTDSMELYGSRLMELEEELGEYDPTAAAVDHAAGLLAQHTGDLLDMTYADRRRVHNLKYFTWIEQQGRTLEELNAQWYDHDYWENVVALRPKLDAMIADFNKAAVGAA